MYLSNHHSRYANTSQPYSGNRAETCVFVGGGVKYACSLPFGDGVFSLEVYKFRGLLYYVMLNLFQHLTSVALYLNLSLAACGRGQDFVLSAAKLRNPGEGSVAYAHNQAVNNLITPHNSLFTKTHPSRNPRRPL